MIPDPRPGILDIKPYKPGNPAPAGAVKLSSNENPLGCSEKAAEAFSRSASKLHVYPDGSVLRLRQAIGKAEGIDPARIVCGAGSDEILQLIGRAWLGAGDTVLQSQYGFLVYRLVAMQSGAELVSAPERDHRTDIDAMLEAAAIHKPRVVFLANPNNPTGTWVPREDIIRLREGLADDCLLVLDAAYGEFVDDPAFESGMGLVDQYDNIIVTRTFSKIHGLAGLRLGWAYAREAVIDILNRVRGPFNVSVPAVEAGIEAIGDEAFITRSKAHNARWLDFLTQHLRGVGLDVTPSVCNFVLVHFPSTPGKTAEDADRFLTSKGLVVRDVKPYGLPDSLRISIGLDEDNRRVADALAEFMA
ncbi:MAG: histidinol-phosphate transaminase [Caulobacterales bacterium]|uniref:histidinol-phosphate transaminase n=1 Tax=Glycocaulis sp. TaxID=1969725 RepID=UPI003FA12520